MKLKTILIISLILLLTLLSVSFALSYVQNDNLLFFLNPEQRLGTSYRGLLSASSPEQPSPYDWIKEEQIEIHDDRIIIYVENPKWAKFTDTNSMDPVIDYGSNAIEIVPQNESDIHVGDIISYNNTRGDAIIHRVLKTGEDDLGWYVITKGDNAAEADKEKIRFDKINRILVMIIY